jgi:hypothetical protein
MAHGALAVVEDWHEALNDGSVERVRGLSADYVRVLGPRGGGMIAAKELGDWMIRSGFSATPERWFCGTDGTVVVEQSARWSDRDDAVEAGRSTVATAFQVKRQRVVAVRRHAELTNALEDAGLSLSDEVTARS